MSTTVDRPGHKKYEPVPDRNLRPGDTDDAFALTEARAERVRERKVQETEINLMKDKVRKCALYAGVNKFEDCGDLAEELWNMIREYDAKYPSPIMVAPTIGPQPAAKK